MSIRALRASLLYVLCAYLLAGCLGTPPDDLPSGGVDAKVGELYLSDIYLEAPDGLPAHASAPLRLTVTSDSDAPDALVGVSTSIAGDVQLRDGGHAVSQIDIPAGGQQDLESRVGVVVEDVDQPITNGKSFAVTFQFAHAGAVTVNVQAGPFGPTNTMQGDSQ